jgi:hypothetical protein
MFFSCLTRYSPTYGMSSSCASRSVKRGPGMAGVTEPSRHQPQQKTRASNEQDAGKAGRYFFCT